MSVNGSQSICALTIFAQGQLASSESRVEYCKKLAYMVDSTFSPVHVLTAVVFFPCLNNRRIFIRSRVAVLRHSGFVKLFFCFCVFLAGILISLDKLALVDGLNHHLHMTEELFWSSLVEDGDGEMHVVRQLDLQDAVLAFDDILFWDCNGWLDTAAPLTILRLQSFRDGFSSRQLD